MGIRRAVAGVAGVVLVLEGVGVAGVQWVMADFLDRQHMSLAGLDTSMLANSLRGGGLFFGLVLVAVGVLALRMAVLDRAPGGFVRGVLIAVAVVHGVLGAVMAGLVGWDLFAVMMAVLALVVFSVIAYGRPGEPPAEPAEPVEPVEGPAPATP
ncbi:hypothetical protein SRB5_50530 [Streptomyces sp. RB5]|uniref:Uncharacterized protein n=1 Tax=Streptomyces smaragdinus TaxID=2585196 RepID=A0A7K0CN15_9ACTN|nr:hypothetical protein [Streptomyces smaragdinus]MQY14877.1 hypothetical protein [Streptomyces smaragdinus]